MNFVVRFLLLFYYCSGVSYSYSLNAEEYSRMPPVFHLDDYDHCVLNPRGIYCTADIDLVSDTPSELLNIIRDYSKDLRQHFNHSQLHYGICITNTCKDFYENKTTEDQKEVLERCLNETLWKQYQLKCRIANQLYCNNITIDIDGGDIAMGGFIVIIIIINMIGSLYDVMKGKKAGNRYLRCFSILHNFNRLTTSHQNLEPREERLKACHGLRTMTIMCVILFHSMLLFSIDTSNTYFGEMLFENFLNFIFLNGMLFVQTFFVISGCLLAYKLEIYSEKHEIKWTMFPISILLTWLKLTPTYAFVLALTCTWLRHAGSGPLWEKAVTNEVKDCRSNGWTNLLYINNYMDHTQCMLHTWFLGTLMQLYILGFAICILVKKGRARQIVMGILFVVGILTPVLHTYIQNLDALYMASPEILRTFLSNRVFNYVYKRAHTNIVNFILGLALGFLIYRLQVNKVDIKKYKKYSYLFLLILPMGLGSLLIGRIFFIDELNDSAVAKAAYAGLIKPIFGVLLSSLILGNVFKLENIYRKILEWDGWKVPSRLSYCSYIVHMFIIRAVAGNYVTLISVSYFQMVQLGIVYSVLSFIAAVPMWLLLDAPVTELLKQLLFYKNNEKTTAEEDIESKKNEETKCEETYNIRI